MTVRDDVWDACIRLIVERGRFRISELPFEEGQRHTVRRVLKEMEKSGWLTRESPQGKTWYAGPDAKELLQLSDQARVLSDPDFEI
jgi:DNA-binding IclR family transcriptional regulator